MRAADGWDSARSQAISKASAVSRFQALSSPAAANASRWAYKKGDRNEKYFD